MQNTFSYNCPRCGYHATTNDDARMLEDQREAFRVQTQVLTVERDRLREALKGMMPWADYMYAEAPEIDYQRAVEQARAALAPPDGETP